MKEKVCSVKGCINSFLARGLCNKHYLRWKKYGDPLFTQHKEFCSIEDCNNKHALNGYCVKHNKRVERHGDPLYQSRAEPILGTLQERFNKSYKINEQNGCWEWVKQLNVGGYGKIDLNDANGKRVTRQGHRISYVLFYGEIPEKMQVLHKCDNRRCVNPNHLFIGTQKDNIHDMLSKGRHVSGWSSRFRIKKGA